MNRPPHPIPFVLPLQEIRKEDLPSVGGKGANLGELATRGFPVPEGFCVSTAAFDAFMAAQPDMTAGWARLEALGEEDLEAVREVGAGIRRTLTESTLAPDLRLALLEALREAGTEHLYAVRSSATAEDLPDASFAGQQDTYLNLRGEQSLLDAIQRCWASLFTDRAILYRIRNQYAHREVKLAVVVQRMVRCEVSGILFTADPVSGHRRITVIEASYGLGEALVSGLVTPDRYRVHRDPARPLEREVSAKQVQIRGLLDGGTEQVPVPEVLRRQQVLTEAQIRELAMLGQRVEEHYGRPQDIEWGREAGTFYLLQARPITSLFPLPERSPGLPGLRAYLSFNHLQVMTDPLTPLGRSTWRHIVPFGRARDVVGPNPYLVEGGGRLFFDLTPLALLAGPRRVLGAMLPLVDELVARSFAQVVARPEFQGDREARVGGIRETNLLRWLFPILRRVAFNVLWRRPDAIRVQGETLFREVLENTPARIQAGQTPVEKVKAVRLFLSKVMAEILVKLPPILAPGVVAVKLLPRIAGAALTVDDLNALQRGLTGNVTTEMDLATGDLGDVARPLPDVVAWLRRGEFTNATRALEQLPGAAPFLKAFREFLERYGMRGPSEIDLGRPRWREDPASLLLMVAGNLAARPGAHRAHHARLEEEARAAGTRLLEAVRRRPGAWWRSRAVERGVALIRNCLHFREHPKFYLIRSLWLVREVLAELAAPLIRAGRIREPGDLYFLHWEEIEQLVTDAPLEVLDRIDARRAEYARQKHLTPPRFMTSEGECPKVTYDRSEMPTNALAGTPVSAGCVEGVARCILDPTREVLHAGEILVAPFTDPGWTPLFVNAIGLVMEVGGTMTHGSVVAREYGIPAVVGVEGATKKLRTGMRLRVDGDRGWVQILEDAH